MKSITLRRETRNGFIWGGDAYSAPAVLIKKNGSWNLHYICRDYLGSITQMTDSNGTLLQEVSYDAWGRLRNPNTLVAYLPEMEPELLFRTRLYGA